MRKLHCLLMALALCATLAANAGTRSPKRDVANNLAIFNSIVKELQTFYVDSIDANKSVRTAIAAMLDDIDPYTEYIPIEDQADFRSMTSGEYGGIGSFIQQRKEGVIFSEPTEGSPAAKAGILPGDLIVKIDNDSVLTWESSKVSERLKGTPGTRVRVTVDRPYVQDSIITFDITRRKIQMPSVPYYGVLRGTKTGYIGLTSFTEKSPDEVKEALLDLKKNGHIEALVFDLRGNGGGLVESAVKILGFFLPKGTEVLRTRGKGQLTEKIYKTSTQPIDADLPIIVLIDGGTASASEIVAGAMQDLDRAVILGSRSYGKGLVQTTRDLPFEGLLKVTIAKYYIPSGRLIQAIDYSHRNPDGSVSRIPDSLTTVFKTRNGREVRDGGGITPDVTVTYDDISRLTYNVVVDNWAFDFGTRYRAQHPEIPSPADFEITDEIFEEFKSTIDPSRFEYDKVCEGIIQRLREAAKVEGYMNDDLEAEIARLEGMLKHDLDHDLDLNRKALEPYLSNEIVNRYFYNRGEVENGLKYDKAIEAVNELLSTPGRYDEILAPAKK